jgi:hypothetical protein
MNPLNELALRKFVFMIEATESWKKSNVFMMEAHVCRKGIGGIHSMETTIGPKETPRSDSIVAM